MLRRRPEKMSLSRERELVDRLNEPDDNYQLLREGVQGFLSDSDKLVIDRKDTNGILQMYVSVTDKMIGVADGSIAERDLVDPSNPERSSDQPDEIIFLDKSARPVSWFMDAFWEQFAKEDAKKPNFDFLNIDRTNWFMSQGHSREISERYLGPNDFDIDKVSDNDIAQIRALFVEGDLTEENWQNEVWNMPARLDNKNILVVDEVKNQGGTLSIAMQLLRRAIPSSVVSGEYFWEPERRIVNPQRQEFQVDSVPVWYDSNNVMGRGVGDVSKAYWDNLYDKDPNQENLKRKIGWAVLSAPHFDMETFELIDDKEAKTLQQDIAYLSYAVASGKVLRRPSLWRAHEDFNEIVKKQDVSIFEINQWLSESKIIKRRVDNASKINSKNPSNLK